MSDLLKALENATQEDLDEVRSQIAEHLKAVDGLRILEDALDAKLNGQKRRKKEGHQPLPFPTNGESDLAGCSIVDAASTILREHAAKGETICHYKKVAEEAKRRGYQGRSDKALEQSFWAMMNRSDVFKAVGGGRYSLAENRI